MTILYHYCSVEAFFNILKSKKIRLHNAYQMNDGLENRLTDIAFHSFVTKNEGLFGQEDSEILRTHYDINKAIPFVFCMSEEKDLLSQWRSYGGDGAGVAIGFNKEMFPKVEGVPGRNISPDMNTGLCQAVYCGHGDVDALVQEIFNSGYKDAVGVDKEKPWLHDFPLLVSRVSPVLKNKSFREEREWRLVHSPLIMSNDANENIIRGSRYGIDQVVKEGAIRTFFEYDFVPAFVSEIWLGPKCKVSSFDMGMFLSLNGYGALPCFRSESSYR